MIELSVLCQKSRPFNQFAISIRLPGIFLVQLSRFPSYFRLEPIENPSIQSPFVIEKWPVIWLSEKGFKYLLIYEEEGIRLTRYIQQVVLMSHHEPPPPTGRFSNPPPVFLQLSVAQLVTLHKGTIKKLPKSQNVFFGGSRTKTEIDGYTVKRDGALRE